MDGEEKEQASNSRSPAVKSVRPVCLFSADAAVSAATAAAYTNDFDDPPLPAGRAARPRRRRPDCPIWPEAATATARPPEVRPRPTAPLCLFSSPTRPPTTRSPLAHSLNGRLTSSHTDSGIQIAVLSIGSGTWESGSRKPITQGFGGPCECLNTRAVHSLSHRARGDRPSRPSVRAFTHIKGSLHITPLRVREFQPFFAGLPLFLLPRRRDRPIHTATKSVQD